MKPALGIGLVATTLLVFAGLPWGTLNAGPANVIIFIGDGMGFEQVKAARYYNGATLAFENFPYQAECRTCSADSGVTDSAAAATALATGFKVNNGVISVAIPGSGVELETLLELFGNLGKSTGLVTTTYLTHATPAGFGAHEQSRFNYEEIAGDYLNQTRPNILFGGGANLLSLLATRDAGYEVVYDSAGFAAVGDTCDLLSAQFGVSHLPYEYDYIANPGDYPYPHLPEMVVKALDTLEEDPDGFFLMVEGGRIDHACHDNNLERTVHETLAFAAAVQAARDWAETREDTLILVTADHEAGGLTVTANSGAGNYPAVRWTTVDHTASNVPVYAWGQNAQLVSGVMDNSGMVEVCTADTDPVEKTDNPDPGDGVADVALDDSLYWNPAVGEQP